MSNIRIPISVKIMFAIILFILLFGTYYFWTVSEELRVNLIKDKVEDTRTQLIYYQSTLQHLLKNEEKEQVQKTVTSLGVDVHLLNASLLDENNFVVASTKIGNIGLKSFNLFYNDDVENLKANIFSAKSNLRNIIWFSNNKEYMYGVSPVVFGRSSEKSLRLDKIGIMYMQYDMTWLDHKVNQLLKTSLWPNLLIFIFMGLSLIFYFNQIISRKIKKINIAAYDLVSSDYEVNLNIKGDDEISDLAKQFINMAGQVKHQHDVMFMQEQRLAKTQEIAHLGRWELNLLTNELSWSDEVYYIFGINSGDKDLNYETFLAGIHPDDRETVNSAYLTSVEKCENEYEVIHRVVQKNTNDIRYVHERCIHTKNKEGKVIGSVGMVIDITERKKSEIALLESNLLLENVLNSTPDLVYAKNTRLEIILANNAYAKAVGKNLDEMYGLTDIEIGWDPEIVHGNPVKGLRGSEEDEKKALNGRSIHIPYDPININGDSRIFDTRKVPLRDTDGNIIGILSVARDTTERLKSAQKIKLHQEEQQQILDNLVDGVITINDTGKILSINKSAELMFGYNHDQAIELNINQFMPEPYATEHTGYIQRYMKTGEKHIIGFGREVDAKHKDGSIFPIRLSVVELPRAIDQRRRFIGSCQDLTQIKQKEEQLRRSQKMDALGKLTGGVAHDYNNMLGVVLGYSELLEEKLTGQPKLVSYIQEIMHAGERGAKLTKKLLSFSSQTSRGGDVVNLNLLLQDEKHMLEKTLTARIKLNLELEDDLWTIQLDESELEDSIINMCINAMHAIDGSGGLTISTHSMLVDNETAKQFELNVGEYVSLSLTDTGSGMDEETKNNIFDPFYSTKGELGTGLGLSQVYGFVERSGGMIKVYSEPGRGSRFTLYFPRYINDDEVKKLDIIQKVDKLNGTETILVVDDEPALVFLTTEVLEKHGYRVLFANNAKEALKILENENIDAMISDVIMPEMDGYELAELVQKKYPQIKIQLASGFSDDRHLNKINNKTLHDNILHKPYQVNALLIRLRELLDL